MVNALGKVNQPVSFKKVVGKVFNNTANSQTPAKGGSSANTAKVAHEGGESSEHGHGEKKSKRAKTANGEEGPSQKKKKTLNGDDLLTADLGNALFAVIGGENSKFAAMKDKLQMKVLKRKKPVARKYSIFFEEDGVSERDIHAALDNDHIVALRCSRQLALSLWPPIAEKCRKKIVKQSTHDPSLTASLKSPHVAQGSLVAMREAACWCIGGFLDQRECQRAGQVIVGEAKSRSEQGGPGRNFFVSRPRAVFDECERQQRLDHLFPSVKDRTKLKIDEEAAYSVSNETSAAKVAQIARKLSAQPPSAKSGHAGAIIDATACVGGNALAFARCFRKVLAIEIDPSKVAFLKENIAHVRSEEQPDSAVPSKLTDDFHVIHGDCLVELPRALDDMVTEEARVLVFADPPWGGRHYASTGAANDNGSAGTAAASAAASSTAGVHLKGSGSLAALVNLCAARPRVGALLLKLPSHFDVPSFLRELTVVRHHDVHLLSNQVTLLVLHFTRQASSTLKQSPPPVDSPHDESRAPTKSKKRHR